MNPIADFAYGFAKALLEQKPAPVRAQKRGKKKVSPRQLTLPQIHKEVTKRVEDLKPPTRESVSIEDLERAFPGIVQSQVPTGFKRPAAKYDEDE